AHGARPGYSMLLVDQPVHRLAEHEDVDLVPDLGDRGDAAKAICDQHWFGAGRVTPQRPQLAGAVVNVDVRALNTGGGRVAGHHAAGHGATATLVGVRRHRRDILGGITVALVAVV